MIQVIRTIIVFIFILVIASCSQIKLQSQWRTNPVNIDGEASDWKDVAVEYHKDPSFITAAVNNDSTLQLMVRFSDPLFARMLFSRGFTVWFDKSENFGIDFMGRFNQNMDPDRRFNRDSRQMKTFSNFKSLESNDFTVIEKKSGEYFSLSDFKDLEASLGIAKQMFCLEINVPLKTGESTIGADIVSGNKVNLRLKIKELVIPTIRNNSGMRPSGGKSGGMIGGRSGGRRGGGSGRSGMGQRPDTGSKEYKLKVTLAENTEK